MNHSKKKTIGVDYGGNPDRVTLVRVTCDAGYLCANFSLPRSLYS